jgi:hypothetical protein
MENTSAVEGLSLTQNKNKKRSAVFFSALVITEKIKTKWFWSDLNC